MTREVRRVKRKMEKSERYKKKKLIDDVGHASYLCGSEDGVELHTERHVTFRRLAYAA